MPLEINKTYKALSGNMEVKIIAQITPERFIGVILNHDPHTVRVWHPSGKQYWYQDGSGNKLSDSLATTLGTTRLLSVGSDIAVFVDQIKYPFPCLKVTFVGDKVESVEVEHPGGPR